MKQIILIVVACLHVSVAGAQAKNRTQISGVITDMQTGQPLAGAYITISDTKAGTISDSTGAYLLKNVPVGHTIIEVSFYGYRTIVEHIDITGDVVRNFALSSAIIINEGITITGVAGATSIRRAPISISRVDKGTLLATSSTNIIDALSRQPGVSQLTTGPAISKPVIRGLGYNRLVVINDGIRQEGQQWGDEHGIEIDENSVSRVEVLRGPASIIYGSDAIAGVINIITTTPLPDGTLRGNILSSYQTNHRQRSLFANLGGNSQGFNWNIWGDYKAAADYKNRYDGRVFNSKFNEKNFGGYAGYNGAWGFTHFIVSRFNQRVGVIEGERDAVSGRFIKLLPGGLEAEATDDDFKSITPAVPYQHVQHLKIITDNSFRTGNGRLTLNIGWQQNLRREFGEADTPEEESLFFDLSTLSYNTALHFDDRNGWNTSVGLNGMVQDNNNRGAEVLIPEYGLFDIGGFVYAKKIRGRATFSGGARYDYRSLTAREFREGGDTRFARLNRSFYNLSGSAGVSCSVTDNFILKANLARGFRAPSMPELSSNGTHEGTNRYEYGNKDLKSEISLQTDAGMEVNSEHVLINAALFLNRINNFIYFRKLAGAGGQDSLVEVDGEFIPAFRFDQQAASLYGGEVLVDIHPHPLDWLHWENTFSYVRGLFRDETAGTRNVPYIPAARWTSELRGEFLPDGRTFRNLRVHMELQHTFSQDHPFTAYGTETATAGYTLLNAGLSSHIMKHNRPLFSVYFNATNLTDAAYQNHLSRLKYAAENPVTGRQGVFNMGRNFSLRLNIPFSF